MSKEQSSPEQQRELVKSWIRDIDHTWNDKIFADLVVKVAEEFGRHPIAEIELILREMESETFLLAKPVMPDDRKNFNITMPYLGDDKEYDYYLSFCFGGREAAEKKMDRIETDYGQNLHDLGKTGLALVRPGSVLASASKGPYN